jgi:hypothetical protein
MITSLADDGTLIQTFRPFSSSGHNSLLERLRAIQMPVELALQSATDATQFSRVMTSAMQSQDAVRYTWRRAEKSKKITWIETCARHAASIVYAYTGMAIHHQDQPAKEMTAISGLPTSDGAPISDGQVEDNKLPRLDNTWEKVVQPMLKSYNSVCGLDSVKVHIRSHHC